MEFPVLAPNVWRSERPYIVTLVDGDRMSAYPVIGMINEDNEFCFGSACQDNMWLVEDRLVENSLITECGQSRILAPESVSHWEALVNVADSMQLEVTESLKEALGKYRAARRAYVSLGSASPDEKAREVSVEYQTALEALGYQVMVEAELQGLTEKE